MLFFPPGTGSGGPLVVFLPLGLRPFVVAPVMGVAEWFVSAVGAIPAPRGAVTPPLLAVPLSLTGRGGRSVEGVTTVGQMTGGTAVERKVRTQMTALAGR